MSLMTTMRTMTRKLNTKMWGLPIIAEPPTGAVLTTDTTGAELRCIQAHGITTRLDPDTGEDIMVQQPTMTIHADSFAIPPKPGETWYFKIPVIPGQPEMKRYRMSPDHFKYDSLLGTITVALIEVQQTAPPVP